MGGEPAETGLPVRLAFVMVEASDPNPRRPVVFAAEDAGLCDTCVERGALGSKRPDPRELSVVVVAG